MLVCRLDAAGVRGDHGERVAHDEHPDEILAKLGGGEGLLVMPGGRVVVPQSAVSVAEALMDERDPREVADLAGPLQGLLVIGRRGLRLPEILRAATHRDQHPEP